MSEEFALAAVRLASNTFRRLREEAKRAVAEDFPGLDLSTSKGAKKHGAVLREYVSHMVLLYKEESMKLARGQLKQLQGAFYEKPEGAETSP